MQKVNERQSLKERKKNHDLSRQTVITGLVAFLNVLRGSSGRGLLRGTITMGARKGAEPRVQNSDRDSSRRLRLPPYCRKAFARRC